MKLRLVVLTGVLACSSWMMAQTTTPQTPPAGTEGQSSAGSEQSTAPAAKAGMRHNMSQGDMRGMRQQMQVMKQQVTKMQSLLDQMKTNVNSMTGTNKQAMQANVQLWQMMIDHMNQMVEHMSSMRGGMMMQHGCMGAGPAHSPHTMHGQPDTGTPANSEKPPKSDQTKNPSTPPQN